MRIEIPEEQIELQRNGACQEWRLDTVFSFQKQGEYKIEDQINLSQMAKTEESAWI